jgi:hypothetical protein
MIPMAADGDGDYRRSRECAVIVGDDQVLLAEFYRSEPHALLDAGWVEVVSPESA